MSESTSGLVELDPGSPAYEKARQIVVSVLRRIGKTEPKSRYGEMADDLENGDLMQIPTWIALQELARAQPLPFPTEGTGS